MNLSPVHARRVLIQAGSYGEHEFTTVATETEKRILNDRYLEMLLEPGAGSRITLGTKRYTRQPSLRLPW